MIRLAGNINREIRELLDFLGDYPEEVEKRVVATHKQIGQRWKAEAVKRVPRNKSTLAQRIVTNTYKTADGVETECGSNVPYAAFTEFGTRFIAGGRVLALGTGVDVTDAMAVKEWPAKTDGQRDATGSVPAALQAAIAARGARGGAQEQMPWLRPAWNAIKDDALAQLREAMKP